MPIDLFSLVLTTVGSWAIHKMLDAAAGCLRCGNDHPHCFANNSSSLIQCPTCSASINQFTNATQHTVRSDGAIVSAYVKNFLLGISWDGTFRTPLDYCMNLQYVNARGEDFVVRVTMAEFHGRQFYQGEKVVRPDDLGFDMLHDEIPVRYLPKHHCAFHIDTMVFNQWGDLLYSYRKLGDFSGEAHLQP